MHITQNTISVSDIARLCGVERTKIYHWAKKWPLPEAVIKHRALTGYLPSDVTTWLNAVHGGKYADRFQRAIAVR